MADRYGTADKQAYLLYYRTAQQAGNPDIMTWGEWLRSKGKVKSRNANSRTQTMYGQLSNALSEDEIAGLR